MTSLSRLTPCLLALLVATLALSPAWSESSDNFKFAVYYGVDRLEALKGYDLVIVSPLMEEEEVRELRESGVVVLGYCSLTTVGGWEPWSVNVTDDMVVGVYEEWGELVVNVSDSRWRSVISYAVSYLRSKDFSGVFLDNIDMVELYPWMASSIVEIVRDLKLSENDFLIAINRGFYLIDELAPWVDFVVFECFGTYFDFNTNSYRKFTGSDLEWIKSQAERLKALSEQYGFKVLALGYADPTNEEKFNEYRSFVEELASQYGFPCFVSDLSLQHLPEPSASGGEAPIAPAGVDLLPVLLCLVVVVALLIAFSRRRASAKESS